MESTRIQQVHASTHPTFRGLHYQPHNFFASLISIECEHCGALKLPAKTESLCCLKGIVQLQPFPQPHPLCMKE